MIGLPAGTRVYIACGATDMRCGFDGLAAKVETALKLDPFGGSIFIFRGKQGDLIKALYWDGQGLVLYAKRLEGAKFQWPAIADGVMRLSPAQLSALLEGLAWSRVHMRRVAAPRAVL